MKQYHKTVQKIINFDNFIKEKIREHKPNCSEILDYLFRILLNRGSGSGKTNLI